MSEAKPLQGITIATTVRDRKLSAFLKSQGAEVRWWSIFRSKRETFQAGIMNGFYEPRTALALVDEFAYKLLERGGGKVILFQELPTLDEEERARLEAAISMGISIAVLDSADPVAILDALVRRDPVPAPSWHS